MSGMQRYKPQVLLSFMLRIEFVKGCFLKCYCEMLFCEKLFCEMFSFVKCSVFKIAVFVGHCLAWWVERASHVLGSRIRVWVWGPLLRVIIIHTLNT